MFDKKSYVWRLGEILIQQGWINWDQLEQALSLQRNPEALMGRLLVKKGFLSQEQGSMLYLGEILVRNGWIDWDHLAEALQIQTQDKRMLGEILLEKKYVTERDLYEALAIQFHMPFVNLKQVTILPETLQMVPKRLAYEYRLLPLAKQESFLLIAVCDPMEISSEKILGEVLKNVDVRRALACPQDLYQALLFYHGPEIPDKEKE